MASDDSAEMWSRSLVIVCDINNGSHTALQANYEMCLSFVLACSVSERRKKNKKGRSCLGLSLLHVSAKSRESISSALTGMKHS